MRAASKSIGMLGIVLLSSSCAGVPTEAGFDEVRGVASDRVAKRVHWRQGTAEDAEIDATVHRLLVEPLTAESAVQIALLNNPHLQASYEELGVAQADVIQAGLLKNPTFIGEARFGRTASLRDIDLDYLQDFLDLLTRSARKRISDLQFQRAKMLVAHGIVEVATMTRREYFALQGTMNVAAIESEAVSAREASFELAKELRRIGNLSELDLVRNQASLEEGRIELARLDGERYEAREALNRLMGLHGAETSWTMPVELPGVPDDEPPLDHLERLAIARRLDLAASATDVQALAAIYAMTNDYRWVGELQFGPSAAERPEVSRWVGGFIASIQLPIFDQGQARVAKAGAELRREKWHLAELAIETRSQVRAWRYRMLVARNIARHYRKALLPLQEKIVALSQRFYNFMLIGTFELLEARKHELETQRDYVKATRDYWVARSELERAAGGRLTESVSPTHEHH